MKRIYFFIALSAVLFCFGCTGNKAKTEADAAPRIVNIINFIRQTEPRDEAITDEVLYQTVVSQVEQLNAYELPGTFLLQYDALINPQYQGLLREKLFPGSEVGAWWEITQPHVEAAGMSWRGRYPWDWHADVGFATGYAPAEREKLVDVYMEKFKSVFGKYPESVGSWFIDAHTLAYMYDKYNIVASCNCKDQIGTDGYTLWGGYWNQGYYPSRKNAYMPAQHAEAQIPVPIFRMLGSDPIYQYDHGLGSSVQGVVSLEPVYRYGGGNRKWVEWFFKSIFDDPCLTYNYTQTGQENSFTWLGMKKGLEIQIPLIDSLRKQNAIRVETLAESGKWFREQFEVTPPTALSALSDVRNEGHKTVWFNSRFYRANLLFKDDSFRFRDIHLFDERFQSDYIEKAGESTQCIYTTLPVLDGFLWSTRESFAGLYIMRVDAAGNAAPLSFNDPDVTPLDNNALRVNFNTAEEESFTIIFYEDRFEISCNAYDKNFAWILELKTAPEKETPFTSFGANEIKAQWKGFNYGLSCKTGQIEKTGQNGSVCRFFPSANKIVVDCRNTL
ncbi:MAG: hypothetical protein FWG22_03520 [Prolixibacteraceae bacterium]|nr:hypothetical protein [Prolixibacteraceae bacterium]